MRYLALALVLLVIMVAFVDGRRHGKQGGQRDHAGNRRHGTLIDHGRPKNRQSSLEDFGKLGGNGRLVGHGRPLGNSWACGAAISRKRLTMKTINKAKVALKKELFAGRPDRYATAVRIAFHDCVGGCDGCINEKHPANAGFILESLKIINRMYEAAYASKMSRADFWILTAVTALEDSLTLNNANLTASYISPIIFNFRYGRCDCPTSPVTAVNRTIPFAHADYSEVTKFFKSEFGFNMKESVAIMGAHTLGGASGAKGSGFEGFWQEDDVASARFNNRYYSLLVNDSLRWNHVDRSLVTGLGEERWQWEAGATKDGMPAPFMLNVDVALVKNVRPKSSGQSSCQFEECAPSPSYSIVKEYARNGDAWIRDFAVVFDKMVSKGANKLKYPTLWEDTKSILRGGFSEPRALRPQVCPPLQLSGNQTTPAPFWRVGICTPHFSVLSLLPK